MSFLQSRGQTLGFVVKEGKYTQTEKGWGYLKTQ